MTQKKASPSGHRTTPKPCSPATRGTRDPQLRDRLVVMHQNLVRYLAGKFVNRGEPLEDLIQVGTIGLINAIDRFDAGRGTKFSTYATPTIVGEIRRYFRDKAWSLKVPRRLQELNQTASKAQEALSTQAGPPADDPGSRRSASASSEEETLEAIELGNAYDTVSLDSKMMHDFGQRPAVPGRVRRRGRRFAAKPGSLRRPGPGHRSRWSRASGPSSSTASSRTCPRPKSPSSSTSRRCTSRACKTAPCTSSSA